MIKQPYHVAGMKYFKLAGVDEWEGIVAIIILHVVTGNNWEMQLPVVLCGANLKRTISTCTWESVLEGTTGNKRPFCRGLA